MNIRSTRRGVGIYAGIVISFLLSFLTAFTATAQPAVSNARIVYRHPVVEWYWTTTCGDSTVYPARDQLRIIENDTAEVAVFDLICPEPGKRYPVTIGFALDRSGSMSGASISSLKAAMHEFIDSLHWDVDEAALVWYSTMPELTQPLTQDSSLLHAGIDGAAASGFTAVWDAAWLALHEISRSTSGNQRVIVLLTDGQDASSTRTVSEIIEMAQDEHIRMITVSVGPNISTTQMEIIAQLTGGHHYHVKDGALLRDSLMHALQLMLAGFNECSAAYVSMMECAMGQFRTTSLRIADVCGDSLEVRKTYRASYDPRELTPIPFSLGHATLGPDGRARVPILSGGNLPVDSLPPFTCTVAPTTPSGYPSSEVRFSGLDTTANAALHPSGAYVIEPSGSSITLTSTEYLFVTGDTVAVLLYQNAGFAERAVATMKFSARFLDGCLDAATANGSISAGEELNAGLDIPDPIICTASEGTEALHSIILRNTGARELRIDNMRLLNIDSTVLRLEAPPNYRIPSSGTAILQLRQPAASPGTQSGILRFESNVDPFGAVHRINVSSVVVPAAELGPPEVPGLIDFGWMGAGAMRDTVIVIRNPNGSPLRIQGVRIEGPDAAAFQLLRIPGAELPPSGSDTLILRCEFPNARGLTAHVRLEHDAMDFTPTDIPLRAQVGWPAWAIARCPTWVSFLSVPIGSYADTVISVFNDGGVPLTVSDQEIRGGDSTGFTILSPLPSVVDPGQRASLTVRFAPMNTVSVRATFEAGTNDPGNSRISMTLSGWGKHTTAAQRVPVVPAALQILGNYPQPFTDHTTLRIALPHGTGVSLTVYDLLGRIMAHTHLGERHAGEHAVELSSPLWEPGIYVAVVRTADGASAMRKLLVLHR